jgi:hypothetical protein
MMKALVVELGLELLYHAHIPPMAHYHYSLLHNGALLMEQIALLKHHLRFSLLMSLIQHTRTLLLCYHQYRF